MYTLQRAIFFNSLKNQCHTVCISTERHAGAASCCYDGHQIERGLRGCSTSIAGRSCSSLLPLRQARICRRISWGLGGFSITLQRYEKTMTYARKVTTIFHIIWTYLDISGQKWTMAPATVVPLHRQSGTTRRRDRIYSSAKEKMPLSGAAKDPPTPFRGRDKKTNLNQTQAWKRSGMIALTAGQRKNDTY